MDTFLNGNYNVTDIILACWVAPGTGNNIHKNRHAHGIALVNSGKAIYTFSDGTTCVVPENHYIFLPKNSTYTVTIEMPISTYCINFQILEDMQFAPFVCAVKNVDESIQAYKNAVKAWSRKLPGYEPLCKSELYKIIYLLKKNHNSPYTPNSKKELLAPAVAYIHKHYADSSLNMEELSNLCGFSYEYFRRMFHQCYGCSPIKYINELKLNRAKELLSSGLYSVSETATLSGFFELSYFSRFFKKKVGVSPNEYINQP